MNVIENKYVGCFITGDLDKWWNEQRNSLPMKVLNVRQCELLNLFKRNAWQQVPHCDRWLREVRE